MHLSATTSWVMLLGTSRLTFQCVEINNYKVTCYAEVTEYSSRGSQNFVGSIMRQLLTINRRKYQVPASLSLWYVDGNHKLIWYNHKMMDQDRPEVLKLAITTASKSGGKKGHSHTVGLGISA